MSLIFREHEPALTYIRGVLEMAQVIVKVIEGGVVTWRHMNEMVQLQIGSKTRSRVKTPGSLTFSDLKL